MEEDLQDEIPFDKKIEGVICEPEDGLYMNILAFLSSKGINKECDISHLFNNSYLISPSLGQFLSSDRHRLISVFLDAMKSADHIKYQNLTNSNVTVIKWLNPVIFRAQITSNGDEYYKKQNKKLEKTALAVSICGILITFIIGMCNIHQELLSKNQQKQLDSLKSKTEQIKHPLRTSIRLNTKTH